MPQTDKIAGSLILSPHFRLGEFQLDGPMPAECIYTYTRMCELLLEPIRLQFNLPLVITSGYRSPAVNAAAGGVSSSQHMATAEYCAADFKIASMQSDMRQVFDWIRSSKLLFDQVILEHGAAGDIIHISFKMALPRRMALEGETANQSAYILHTVTSLDT